MDNQTFQRIKDLITQHQAIGVVMRGNATLDETAGALGMYLVLANMGKAAAIASPTDPVVGVSNLVGVQKITKSLAGGVGGKGGNLTVSFPYKDGEIEKVSYTQENGFLNIQVMAGPNGLGFQQSDVKFVQAGAAGAMPTLLFAIGVPSLSEISSVVSQADLQNMTVVNIDNKPNNEKYGDVVVVSPRFSSVSEQVADFLTLLEPQIELDKDTSQNLFDGISFATKDYTAPNTSYLAFEMAGILMKKGATRYKAAGAAVQPGQNVSQYFPPMQNNPLSYAQAQDKQVVQNQPVQAPVQPQPSAGQNFAPSNMNQNPQFAQPVQQPMPQSPVQPMPQMPVQPQFNQPFVQTQGEPMQNQGFAQPMQQPVNQPMSSAAQNMQPSQVSQQAQGQAPADWLTPKVYKGSSVL